MNWVKKGLIFTNQQNTVKWQKKYTQVPTVLIKNNRLRVYFSTRPKKGLSLTTYLDLDINNIDDIIYINPKPILDLGGPGAFDEHGIMPSSIIDKNGIVYLYYSGWSRSYSVPYSNFTGLAISEDGGSTFKKYSKGPIIDRTSNEIYSATSPCVYFDKIWHMWYSSGIDWIKVNGKIEHTYDIKYAWSYDGIAWSQTGKSAIKQKNKYEAITRPTLIKINKKYHMWYCFRGSRDFRNGKDSYKIGHAVSKDLIVWERLDDDFTIKKTKKGWDSKMVCYPHVIKLNNSMYMFYNGNSFGENGIGIAKLELD